MGGLVGHGKGEQISRIKMQKYRLKFKNWIDDVGWVFIMAGEIDGNSDFLISIWAGGKAVRM
jgi:hypothetical protein